MDANDAGVKRSQIVRTTLWAASPSLINFCLSAPEFFLINFAWFLTGLKEQTSVRHVTLIAVTKLINM